MFRRPEFDNKGKNRSIVDTIASLAKLVGFTPILPFLEALAGVTGGINQRLTGVEAGDSQVSANDSVKSGATIKLE